MAEATATTIEKPTMPVASEPAAEEKTPAEVGEGAAEEEKEPTDEEINAIQPGKASVLDPDFILIFFFAVFLDLIKDPVMGVLALLVGAITGGGGAILILIINVILEILAVVIIGSWMYWRSKQFVIPDKLAKRMKKMERRVIAKIEMKISKKIASKALRRVLIRAGVALGVEAFPPTKVFTSWIVAVASMAM